MTTDRSTPDESEALDSPDSGQVSPLTAVEQKRVQSRRRFLKIAAGGSLGALGVAFAFPVLAIKSLTQFEDVIAKGDVVADSTGRTAVDVKSFPVNSAAWALPLGKPEGDQLNQIQLVRVAQTGQVDDFRAFSRVCTHVGCSVNNTLNAQGHIQCPCHGSQFDASTGEVVHGPAVKTLPHIAIVLNDQGQIVINSDDYSAPIGPPT